MKDILVTGATGFVGSALVKKLTENGHSVKVTVRDGSDRRNITGLDVNEVNADILDKESIRRAMQGCSHVYHVAGLYRTWMSDYSLLTKVNVQGTQNVLEAAMEMDIEKVVYTSSIAALGVREDGKASDENTRFNLFHLKIPYEISKYEAENAALEYSRKGLPIVIVRPALVMGEGDIYPTPSGRMVLNIIEGKMPSYFDGGIDVVDVDDVADGHIFAMERGRPGESYNLGTKGNFAIIKDLFQLIAETGGVKPPKLPVPVSLALLWAYGVTAVSDYITHKEPVATPGNIHALSVKKKVDFSKAISELGLPQTPLTKIVEKTVKWYRDNGYF